MKQLGQVLIDQGLITQEQLQLAMQEQRDSGRSLGRILVSSGAIAERDLVTALAAQVGMEFVDLSEADVDPRAVTLVAPALARRHALLPIRFEDGKLVVAMSDPSNVVAMDDIRTVTNMDIKVVIATRENVLEAIERYSAMADDIEAMAGDLAGEEDGNEDLASLTAVTEEAPIVKFVNLLISQAVADGASDIHIEPGEKDLRVRYRIDGVLHEVMRSPKTIQSGVISRLKIMAEVDIAERRIPQDGRIGLHVGGKAIDLRFSTLPTVFGEKVVMRILDKTSVMLTLDDLGFLDANERRFQESYTKPYGMILVTGPTGSGKSTTLYATLNVLNQPGVNCITTEDPVEYQLPGISQVQVNNKVGLTFAAALRSILRQDPDIILVGEMRDRETAQIGVEAALTGHLVLSTLHTNDAPSAVTRLTEMGIEPFLVGSAVDCVLAQRLARRVCSKCVEMVVPDAEVLKAAGFDDETVEARPAIPRAVGCSACSNTGYRGRLALHEVMTVSEEIERMAVGRASSEDIGRVAVEQGMRPLRTDGLAKVLLGRTTIEEIGRVVV
ncbi:GspE/PulE family protein [Nitriliruptor alkaliphilus]|uniref:GspE/PulE family protein n=1 Tax=Nitriliruptor alkaliphilus TaxID=427918 RepID=UPI00069631E9|nr:ATPase, T2SS/T4P/T4SS family [Nitriliruptor alkaliphilus]